MRKYVLLLGILFTVIMAGAASAHADRYQPSVPDQELAVDTDAKKAEWVKPEPPATGLIPWFGQFHPMLLHFPIALILMTVIAELLFFWFGYAIFNHAARFMLIAAAIIVIPTALSGLALGAATDFQGHMAVLYWWHRLFGVITLVLAIPTALLRELCQRNEFRTPSAYYCSLALLFISVSVTGFLGGELVWGPMHLLPS